MLTPTDSEGDCHFHLEYNGLLLNVRVTDYGEETPPDSKQAACLLYNLTLRIA